MNKSFQNLRLALPLFCLLLFIFCPALQAQRAQPNYDEAKVPVYVLPDVLTLANGKTVRNKRQWEQTRRGELLQLFEDNIYGDMPESYDSIRYTVVNEDKQSMEGKAHLKEISIEVFHQRKSVKIRLVLFVPLRATKPAPAFVLINNRGKENMDATREIKSGFWPAEVVVDAGYAVAAFQVDDLAPDNPTSYLNGVLAMYPEQLEANNGMRAIGSWAWGASRVMDYFEQEASIDPNKVVVVGHSRGGKASLWAAAQDKRFALCVTNCSGNTGAALARRQFGERVAMINNAFPHWFTPNYKKYNDREDQLPVDQHMLIALIAPRPVYATNATEDLWADPKGTYLALKHAEPVFQLYKLPSALPKDPPAVGMAVVESPLAYHIRDGKHDLTEYDWRNFIKFADFHFSKK